MTDRTSIFEGASTPKLIAKFAVPTILSQLITLIYNLADTYFVGQTNDPAQVAALALSFPIFMATVMVSNLFGIGANSFISRSLGRKRPDEARKASAFAVYGGVLAMIAFILILEFFMEPILHVVGARTPETYEATAAYLRWTIIIGGIPSVISLLLAHLVRAEGNTRQASIGMISGGLMNILLDWVFVAKMQMGAEGAGVATCIANVISLIYLLVIIIRKKDTVIVLDPRKSLISPVMIKQILSVGLPSATIIIMGSVANIVLTAQMSVYGDVSIAAFGIVQKFGTIAIQITVGLTQGIMPLLGYHYGARNIKKVKEINKWSFGTIGVYAAFCLILVECLTKPLVTIFMTDPETVAKAVTFARIWIICAPGLCFTNLFCSIFQAMGRWAESLTLSIFRQGVILIPLLIILNKLVGEIGLVCSHPTADTLTLILGFILYIRFMKGKDNENNDSV